jgi:hypothetical protein
MMARNVIQKRGIVAESAAAAMVAAAKIQGAGMSSLISNLHPTELTSLPQVWPPSVLLVPVSVSELYSVL